jgi:hypothetical protein
MDVKHVVSGLIGMALSAALAVGLTYAEKNGVHVDCPSVSASPSPAVK